MSMRVCTHILLGYAFCSNSHISLERIASEVIHPDDIDVNFSGMSGERSWCALALSNSARYWRPRRHHIFVTRIRHHSASVSYPLSFIVDSVIGTKGCPIIWAARVRKDIASQGPCQGVRRHLHQHCRISVDKQMVR